MIEKLRETIGGALSPLVTKGYERSFTKTVIVVINK